MRIKTFAEHKLDESLNEYATYVIPTMDDLIKAIEEIGVNVKITYTDKSMSINGKTFRFPEMSNDWQNMDTSKDIAFDNKVVAYLHDLCKDKWEDVKTKYEALVNQIKELGELTVSHGQVHFGPTAPDSIKKILPRVQDWVNKFRDISTGEDFNKILREYEVMRHLFDRGYLHQVQQALVKKNGPVTVTTEDKE